MSRAADSADSEEWQIGDQTVLVSHLTKRFWPEAGVTKGDLLRYYLAIAPVVMPFFHDRPVTIRVYPEGVLGPSFYQRDRPEHAPAWLRGVAYQPKTAKITRTAPEGVQLTVVDNTAGLIWLANAGGIELHLWAAKAPGFETPDHAIFDLDPGEAATFEDVCQVALQLRETLLREELQCYVKTSGARGLHVYAPLAAEHTFERVRAWVKGIAERLAAADPDLIALAHGPTHRGRQVTLDYAQNSIGRNTAAPYTVRARPAKPVVSTPLGWEEIEAGGVDPSELTPQVVTERLRQFGDLFAPLLQDSQHLPIR